MARAGRVAILTYHAIDNGGGVLSTPPSTFAEHVWILNRQGQRVVGLMDAYEALSAGSLSENLVVITFDDGFPSVVDYAWPVLRQYGFPATLFAVTDYCGKSNAWPSQPAGIQLQPLLDWAQLARLSTEGLTIGSHTRTHPHLNTLDASQLHEELAESRSALQEVLGVPVDTLAYPYGSCNARVRQVAAKHYRVACSTKLGFATHRSDLYALQRLDAFYLRRPRLVEHLFAPSTTAYLMARQVLRDARHRLARRRLRRK